MRYQVRVGSLVIPVDVEGSRVTVNGVEHRAELREVQGTPLRLLLLDQDSWLFAMDGNGGGGQWTVQSGGERIEVEVIDERTAHIRSLVGAGTAATGPPVLKAPMPGMVVRVQVEPGQQVTAGASLLVLEAMKMENELKAQGSGVIHSIAVAPGQVVEKGAILLTFQSG